MSDLRAIDELGDQLRRVVTVRLPLFDAHGRVLSRDLTADRDSPAADVSAMDGYALSSADLPAEPPAGDEPAAVELPVVGESIPGTPPPQAPPVGSAVRIFTGAVVPAGCDAVLRREDVHEFADRIQITRGANGGPSTGHIRHRGENAAAGSIILRSGSILHAGHIAAAANFGAATVEVARSVRVQPIVTGDELLGVEQAVEPWQLRDSNGPTLSALLGRHPWIHAAPVRHAVDSLDALTEQIATALRDADAVLLTGGVSMGDYDFVPAAARAAGCRQVFHKLPVRPGKPIFGAVGPEGQLIIGLPGNPVSAAVGTVRFVLPLLRRMASCEPWMPLRPAVMLEGAGPKTLPLHWFRLVRLTAAHSAELVASRGSGDLVSLAASSGFIEQPPDTTGPGPWPYWSWTEGG